MIIEKEMLIEYQKAENSENISGETGCLPQHLTMSFLGRYTKESTSYYRDTFSSLLTDALFIISRNWMSE